MRVRFQHLRMLVEDEIRRLVVNDELVKASLLLLDLAEVFEKSRVTEAILIARGASQLYRELNSDVLDYESARQEGNKLTVRIIRLLDAISADAEHTKDVAKP